jgi:hypothetical protein
VSSTIPFRWRWQSTAFKNLTGEEVIHMIHRREPIPLFEIITKNGGRYLSVMER